MDSATQDLFYQQMKESIFDEEKIVTCISLAANFHISLGDAKMLLAAFVKDTCNAKSEKYNVTYLLSGILKDGKRLAVDIVNEKNLDEKKSLFESVYSQVIYSIQKNENIDFNTIILSDKISLESSDEIISSVTGRNSRKRNIKINKKNDIEQIDSSGKNKAFLKKAQANSNNNDSSIRSSQKVSKAQEKQTKKKNPGGITNFFMKASTQTNGEVTQKKEDTNTINDGLSSQPGIVDKTEDTTQNENVSGINDSIAEKENKQSDAGNNSFAHSQSKGGKKRKKVKSVNVSNKKRKRIQEICDSDSSDIFDDEKDEDVIEKSDEEPNVPIVTPASLPKNKKRKAVDEVHMDEDGFMVTTTKYIYESASDDEIKPLIKAVSEEKSKVLLEKKNGSPDLENDAKPTKNKGSKNKKGVTGVQTTLMKFFQKK